MHLMIIARTYAPMIDPTVCAESCTMSAALVQNGSGILFCCSEHESRPKFTTMHQRETHSNQVCCHQSSTAASRSLPALWP